MNGSITGTRQMNLVNGLESLSSNKMNRNNGHTHCCGNEPTLRVSPRTGLVYYECKKCTRKGCDGIDDQDAGENWELMLLRVKYQDVANI